MDDAATGGGGTSSAGGAGDDPPPDIGDVLDELEEIEDDLDDPEDRARVREAAEMVSRVQSPVFGRVIRGFDRTDAAEALLGSVIFGIPMLVEGGTQEVGEFVAIHPPALALTLALAVGIVGGILYVAEIQDVRIHQPLFGVVPRRFVGVLSIALATSVVTMTAWGRVEWSEPWLATCTVVVTFVPMAIGGALGDILPGS